MRKFDGEMRIQGLGTVPAIFAINAKVGDRRVWNGGTSSEIIRIEVSKTGKTVDITTLWTDTHSKLVDGQWVSEVKEDTRRCRAKQLIVVEFKEEDTIPEVEEVNEPKQEIKQTAPATKTVKVSNQPKKSAFQKWIELFIEEKGYDLNHEFTISHDGTTHFMTLEFLISAMISSSKQEQAQIKDKIVYIDFKNGDILHFFNFLATAYVKTNY